MDNRTHLQNVPLLSYQYIEYFHKSQVGHKYFFGKCYKDAIFYNFYLLLNH